MRSRQRYRLAGSFLLLSACFARGTPELTPTIACDLNGTNSVVYCPTLQVAWDGLKDIVGGPVQMQRQDAMVLQLNGGHCPAGVIPEESHVAMAGFVKMGIADQIKAALRVKFGDRAPLLPPILSDKDTEIFAYAHLQRSIPFPRKFLRSSTSVLRFDNGSSSTNVEYFGASERSADDYSAQVRVLHYAGKNEFALCLTSKNADDFLVLSKMEKPPNLAAGVKQTLTYLQAEDKGFSKLEVDGKPEFFMNALAHGDFLAIPVINLNVAAEFPQLCNRLFSNQGFERALLKQVFQDVCFKLDESGAVVRSTAHAAAAGGSSKPRRFVFDKPFLLTLWKKSAEQPYLAVWVASPDVLVPFKSK